MTRIELSIDELVLVGFEPRERHAIGDAIGRALGAKLLATDVAALVNAREERGVVHGPDVRSTAATSSHAALADGIGDSIVRSIDGRSAIPTIRATMARATGAVPTGRSDYREAR